MSLPMTESPRRRGSGQDIRSDERMTTKSDDNGKDATNELRTSGIPARIRTCITVFSAVRTN
jgi:hypothetical protein